MNRRTPSMDYNIRTPRRSTERTRFGFGIFGIGLVLILLVFGVGSCVQSYRNSERTLTTVVIDKERVCKSGSNGSQECEYLVFTEDGTFKVTDSFGILTPSARFNSSDVYGRIKPGPATLTVIGWRMGFFSMYPNIIEIDQSGGA